MQLLDVRVVLLSCRVVSLGDVVVLLSDELVELSRNIDLLGLISGEGNMLQVCCEWFANKLLIVRLSVQEKLK